MKETSNNPIGYGQGKSPLALERGEEMTITLKDERINRHNCAKGYCELCHVLVLEQTALDRDFTKVGWKMTYDSFEITSWRADRNDVQVECRMDFKENAIKITVKKF